jgi:hypothetical protein
MFNAATSLSSAAVLPTRRDCGNGTLDCDVLPDLLRGLRVRDNGQRLSAHWKGERKHRENT